MDSRSSLLSRVIGPSSRIRGEEERTRARLLAVIMLAHFVAILLGTVATEVVWRRTLGQSIFGNLDGAILLSSTTLVLASWLVLRLGAPRLGTGMWLFACTAFLLIVPFLGHPRHGIALQLGVVMIPFLIVFLVLPRRLDDIVRRSEERYRSLFATVTDAILISDREEKLIEVNDTATQQLGYTREEMLAMHLIDLVPPENVADFRRVQEQLDREGHLVIEASQKRKNGSVIPVELAVSLVNTGGEPMFVAVSRDISERRKTEEEHRRLEEQLHHASKMESIGRLAGGVSHDFNNLLTAILGNLEIIAHKQRQGDGIEEPLAEIREATLSASTLTRHLLAFSRKQVVEPHLVDANELLERMQRMLQRLIGENIKLRTIKGEGLGTIRVDPSLIERTIVNMVINARDAMPGGGLLVIETADVTLGLEYQHDHPLVAPGRYVMFAISDTGTGMSHEVKSHLFEPFFTTKPHGQGTGLGLATSYGAIRQSNGHITVYSEPGKGTTFKIFLPVVSGDPERLVTPSPDEPGALAGGGETILVVEDDDRVRSLVARSLKTGGYTVLVASHGEEALALARATQGKIHLLLTDVVMPGINGRQLSERLAEIHPETRTLFTSGYTENIVIHHGVLEKGIHFLGKPYTLDALAKRVRSVLDA